MVEWPVVVAVGDRVGKGALLARLDSTTALQGAVLMAEEILGCCRCGMRHCRIVREETRG